MASLILDPIHLLWVPFEDALIHLLILSYEEQRYNVTGSIGQLLLKMFSCLSEFIFLVSSVPMTTASFDCRGWLFQKEEPGSLKAGAA